MEYQWRFSCEKQKFYNNHQLLVEIYRLVIFMPSEGKRKFYNNRLFGQRSMACVSLGWAGASLIYWYMLDLCSIMVVSKDVLLELRLLA